MTQTQAGPRRFHGDLPRTETGRHYVAAFDDDTDRWAAAVNLACAIEQQAAALERHKVVELVEAVALLIRPARREEYGEPGNRQWRDVDDAWTQLRAILDALASERTQVEGLEEAKRLHAEGHFDIGGEERGAHPLSALERLVAAYDHPLGYHFSIEVSQARAILDALASEPDRPATATKECPECGGTGGVYNEDDEGERDFCGTCGGSGRLASESDR